MCNVGKKFRKNRKAKNRKKYEQKKRKRDRLRAPADQTENQKWVETAAARVDADVETALSATVEI